MIKLEVIAVACVVAGMLLYLSYQVLNRLFPTKAETTDELLTEIAILRVNLKAANKTLDDRINSVILEARSLEEIRDKLKALEKDCCNS